MYDEIEKAFNASIKCAQIIDDLAFFHKLAVIQILVETIAFQYGIDAVELYEYLFKSFKSFKNGNKCSN